MVSIMNKKQKFLIIRLITGYFIILSLSTSTSIAQATSIGECAKWNISSRKVIFGQENSTFGDDDYILNLSHSGLDVNRQTGEIAVLDDNNHRVHIFNQSDATRTLFAILSDSSNSINKSMIHFSPAAITYDVNHSIWIFDGWTKEIVKMKYPLQYGENATSYHNLIPSNGIISFNGTAVGLVVDNAGTSALISDYYRHQIIRHNASMMIQRVHGNGAAGNQSDQLNHPTSIVMDDNGTLFVNDFGNNRIQMFRSYWTYGITLPTNISGCVGLSLYPPNILVMNTKTAVYLFNLTNNVTRCAIGCNDSNLTDIHNAIIDNDENLIITESNQIVSYSHYEQCPNGMNQSTTTTTTKSTTTTTTESTTTTNGSATATTASPIFSPVNNCLNGKFGINCSHSNKICDLNRPCLNSGTCIENQTNKQGYDCTCPWGFKGINCEDDQRPCKTYTCFERGTCIPITDTSFECQCAHGYEGKNCEKTINLCANVTCQNHGVCSPHHLNYTCHCLPGFNGRHCEITETSARVHTYVKKSFGYIAILMLALVIGFIIFMDILKYVFGIDPVKSDRKLLQKQKMKTTKKKNKVQQQQPKVVQRFHYVD